MPVYTRTRRTLAGDTVTHPSTLSEQILRDTSDKLRVANCAVLELLDSLSRRICVQCAAMKMPIRVPIAAPKYLAVS